MQDTALQILVLTLLEVAFPGIKTEASCFCFIHFNDNYLENNFSQLHIYELLAV